MFLMHLVSVDVQKHLPACFWTFTWVGLFTIALQRMRNGQHVPQWHGNCASSLNVPPKNKNPKSSKKRWMHSILRLDVMHPTSQIIILDQVQCISTSKKHYPFSITWTRFNEPMHCIVFVNKCCDVVNITLNLEIAIFCFFWISYLLLEEA